MTGAAPVDIPGGAGRSRRQAVLSAVLLVWVAAVLAAYYAGHKPWPPGLSFDAWDALGTPPTGVPLWGAVLDLATALWLTLAATGTGLLLLHRLKLPIALSQRSGPIASLTAAKRRPEPVEGNLEGGRHPQFVSERDTTVGTAMTLAFASALGLGAFGLSVFALGCLGLLAPLPIYFLTGLFSGLALIACRVCPLPAPRTGRLPAACLLPTALVGFLILTQALTPPVAWDSLVYHLTAPSFYIARGAIAPGLEIPHAYFPSLVEQLFTAAMILRGDVAAQVMHTAVAGAGVLAVFAFLDREHSRGAAWLGAALLATVPSLVGLARVPYVEWGVITFAFLSFWALQTGLRTESDRWFLLSGVLAGLALGTKYTAVFAVLGVAIPLAARAIRRPLGGPRPLLLWSAAASLVAGPWFLKNLVLTGNPVYPFLFEGWNWDSWKAGWFSRPGTGLITEPLRLLIAPWELTVASTQGGGVYDVDLGPLPLAFLPLLLLLRPRVAWAPAALAVVAVGYGAWLLGVASSSLLLQGRLLLPVVPFLSCLLAAALAGSPHPAGMSRAPSLDVRWVLRAALIVSLLLALGTYVIRWLADPPLPYLLRTESRPGYLERHLGEHYRALDFINSRLPADSRVLFLWEPRSYLCTAACVADPLLLTWRHLLHLHGTGEAAVAAVRQSGYTHLLVNGGGLRFFAGGARPEVGPEHVQALQAAEATLLDRLYGPSLDEVLDVPLEAIAGSGYIVFRVRERP